MRGFPWPTLMFSFLISLTVSSTILTQRRCHEQIQKLEQRIRQLEERDK